MPRKIIAIWDKVANDVGGQLVMFNHDAPAIRFFEDVYTGNRSVSEHAADYQLVELGVLDDDGTIIAGKRVILEGSTLDEIKKAQNKEALT